MMYVCCIMPMSCIGMHIAVVCKRRFLEKLIETEYRMSAKCWDPLIAGKLPSTQKMYLANPTSC